MTGYTPLFGSLTTGTLCGRWPDIGLWPIILALADRSGVVDVTPQYVAGVTGLALPEVVACMDRFCQPDPYSRSAAEDGRRLVLLAPDQRNWGWQIVNFGLYREKARLMAKSMREVESGRNRDRLASDPPETAAHRRSPPETAAERPSDNTRQDKTRERGRARIRASRVPEGFEPDIPYALSQIPDLDASREVQKFRDWEFRTPRSDWSAAWRNWVEKCRESGKYAKLVAAKPGQLIDQRTGQIVVFDR